MTGNTKVSSNDFDEVRVALGGPDGSDVADEPEQEARDPKPQTNTESGGQCAVDDGDRPRSTAHQDRFCQRTMDRCHEAWDLRIHQIITPPPKEKNDRKKLEAANAIDKPNTIWISLRKPPDVSPKASERPVTMMMMTAMIFATGPSTDCRIWLSGCYHRMFEPAADAEVAVRQRIGDMATATAPR